MQVEEELIQSKIQIGDMMNIIMEQADGKLVDQLTSKAIALMC
jgi:hypothetical protein